MAVFSKILVANRGEIAIRVFRTLRELGIGTVAVYSEADRGSLHVAAADEAYLIGPGPATESYLNQERLLETAARARADAIHPGYGFLAENADFARACQATGFVWIGPPPEAIDVMGSKTAARETMRAAGVPIVPGTTAPVRSAKDVRRLGDELGWPIAIKASAGGGGKGLKVVAGPDDAERAYESARREGEAYFSDPDVYVERYLEDPRHVEVQILADAHGNVIHLGERDCTIQRRHQKLVEETPSPAVGDELRNRIGRLGIDAARAVGYRSAGTEVAGPYDPLIAELVVQGVDREHARRRMLRALDEYQIGGVTTLLGFHRALLEHACFIAGQTCHGVVESKELAERAEQLSHQQTTLAASADGRLRERVSSVELDGRLYEVKALVPEPPFAELARRRRERTGRGAHHGAAKDAVVTPMQGTVLAVEVADGDDVRAGQVICIVEAMKMENEITAHRDGVVTELSVESGQAVTTGQIVCVIAQDEE